MYVCSTMLARMTFKIEQNQNLPYVLMSSLLNKNIHKIW